MLLSSFQETTPSAGAEVGRHRSDLPETEGDRGQALSHGEGQRVPEAKRLGVSVRGERPFAIALDASCLHAETPARPPVIGQPQAGAEATRLVEDGLLGIRGIRHRAQARIEGQREVARRSGFRGNERSRKSGGREEPENCAASFAQPQTLERLGRADQTPAELIVAAGSAQILRRSFHQRLNGLRVLDSLPREESRQTRTPGERPPMSRPRSSSRNCRSDPAPRKPGSKVCWSTPSGRPSPLSSRRMSPPGAIRSRATPKLEYGAFTFRPSTEPTAMTLS